MIGSASSSSSSIGVRNEAEELGCERSTVGSGVAAGFAATVGFAGGGVGVDASSVAIAGGTVRLVTTKTLAGEPRRTGTSTTGSAVTVGGATWKRPAWPRCTLSDTAGALPRSARAAAYRSSGAASATCCSGSGRGRIGPRDAEARAVLAQRRRHRQRLIVAAEHGDRRRVRARDGHGLAILDRRAILEVDRARVGQRQDAAATGARRLLDPFGRRMRRGVLLS